jgi:hypothetical protein
MNLSKACARHSFDDVVRPPVVMKCQPQVAGVSGVAIGRADQIRKLMIAGAAASEARL